jgi:hypothetical protein
MLSQQEISDRIEIGMLLDRYAGAIDRADMDLFDSCFTADAWIDYTAFAEFGGIAGFYPEIRQWLASRLVQSPGHQHLVANREIDLEGDCGHGRVMCFNPMRWPRHGSNRGANTGFLGLWYVDEYLRTSEGWRITSRREERCFNYNLPAL